MSDKRSAMFQAAEIKAFLGDDPESSRVLMPLYQACNEGRKGRQGRLKKKPFALYWLLIQIDPRRGLEKFIRRAIEDAERKARGLPSLRLVHRKNPKKDEALEKLYRMIESDRVLEDCFSSIPDIEPTLAAYKRRGVLEEGILKARDPGEARRKEEVRRLDAAEKELDKIGSLPSSFIEGWFNELEKISPDDKANFQTALKQIRKENKLSGKLFGFLIKEKAAGRGEIKQRELERKFSIRTPALMPILELLSFDRIIVWDPVEKSVRLNGYDPLDRRRFQWLSSSSWPRSPFEPYLETGRIFNVKDFRAYVVDEWVRQGSAKYL